MVEAEHENLAVADLAGFRRGADRVDDLLDLSGGAGDFDFDLGQKAHRIFGAAIDFSVPLLPPVSLHLGDGQALNTDFSERVAHLVQLEWLDNSYNDFHRYSSRPPAAAVMSRATA